MSQTLFTPSILLEEKTKYKSKITSINFSLPTTNTAYHNVERRMEKGWDLLELKLFCFEEKIFFLSIDMLK